jgi:DNA-binding FadR family transcriptional regulator
MAARSEKAAARVAQEIVQTIYDENLAPGDRYLSEADALARHNVSRATYREALRFLEFQGVIRVRAGPSGGTFVDKPDWPHLTSTFALLLQFADAPIAQVMSARAALEPEMARQAAQNATAAQVGEMEALLALAEQRVADAASFTAAYRRFWAALAAATGNAVSAMLWPALRALVDSGGFTPNEVYRKALVARMRALLTAVRDRDGDAAHLLMRDLAREFGERLEENYPQRFARTIAWSDVQS